MNDRKYRFDADSPLISVIVPVYNVEAYLRKCLDSIAAQTLKNFEVVIVNDGSPDQSQTIIDEFVGKYENFRCIKISNHGIGYVRNVGVRESKGEYIAFVDSDDWVNERFLEDFWDKAEETKADVVCCEFYYTFASGFKICVYPGMNKIMEAKKTTRRLINDVCLHHFPWNKIYKRKLFVENDVHYPTILFEDIATTARVVSRANYVAFISKPNYYYFQRRGSIMHNVTYRRLQEHINACAILRAYCDKMGYQKDFSHNLRFARWMLTINVIGEIIQLNPEKREQSIPRDILNAVRQIRAFKNKQLPIKGEPWEEVIRNTLYRNEEVPNYLNYYRDEEKPYCSFYDDYDSEQKKQYAEI